MKRGWNKQEIWQWEKYQKNAIICTVIINEFEEEVVKMGFFVGALIFFVAMILTLAFTIVLYICLAVAVKNNSHVPKWMYKIGHALARGMRGVSSKTYKDFTDKSVLIEVTFYIVGVVIASIAVYFIFYGRYYANDAVAFWIRAEMFIIVAMRLILIFGKLLLCSIFSAIGKTKYNCEFSAAANAVIDMFPILIFVCVLTLNMTGLPEKAPSVQVEEYPIIVGRTSANDLLLKGFTFSEKNSDDIIVNKRDSHFFFGETVELVKDGKGYGYVNLTPKYTDRAKLEDCVITYYGISSESEMLNHVKICDKNLSELPLDYFEERNMRDAFSLSPLCYQESMVKGHYSLVMQTHPYMLWKRYTIEVNFFEDNESSQFEVFAQHTLWE